jgi:uncharacterized protein (DUF486 family)
VTVRALLLVCAVICLVFAAFDLLHNDVVSWLILGLAFWAAAFIAPPEHRLRRRRV